MSTARFNNAGAVGTGTTIDNMGSRAKAHALVNDIPATPTIGDSLNLSSVTDTGVGNARMNFTAAMLSANFSILSHVYDATFGKMTAQNTERTGTYANVAIYNQSGTITDDASNSVIFGFLA